MGFDSLYYRKCTPEEIGHIPVIFLIRVGEFTFTHLDIDWINIIPTTKELELFCDENEVYLFSYDECIAFVEKWHIEDVNWDLLKEFWDKYPDGMITFS